MGNRPTGDPEAADIGTWQPRAVCQELDPEMPWLEEFWPEVLHQCLTHCPVLAECRVWSMRYDWRGCVVGGLLWVQKHQTRRGFPAVHQPRPSSRHCGVCRVSR